MIFTIISGALILLFIQWLLSSPFRWWGRGIKWHIPWPLVGNTVKLVTNSYPDFWMSFYNSAKGEKMVGLHIFTTPAIMPRSPEIIKQFMITDADSFNSHGFYTSDVDPFKLNLFASEGEQWKGYRTKMTPYFSPARIKMMMPIVKEVTENFVKEIESKSTCDQVEVDDICIKLSTDVIISTVFGLQGDCFTNPNSYFFALQKELLGVIFQFKALVALTSEWLYDLICVTAFKKSTTDELTKMIKQVMMSRLKEVGVREDFMQGMMELYKKDMESTEKKTKNQDGTKFSRFDEKGVMAQCMILFVAGSDTNGHTLSWCLYELSLNQDVQERLRDEIMKVREDSNGVIDNDEILEITYLDMVVSETSRKYPTAPFLFRKCTKTTNLGGVKIDKDTLIVIPIMAIHWDSRFYPDPEVFDPDRFSPGVQRESCSYLPFGLGPRQCIGMKMAQMTIKLALCELLTKFKITTCSKSPKKPMFDFGPTIKPLNGMYLSFEKLDNKF